MSPSRFFKNIILKYNLKSGMTIPRQCSYCSPLFDYSAPFLLPYEFDIFLLIFIKYCVGRFMEIGLKL